MRMVFGILGLVITLAMQVKFDELTVEEHTQSFLATSALVAPLQQIAHGGAKVVKELTMKISSSLRKNVRDTPDEDANKANRASAKSSWKKGWKLQESASRNETRENSQSNEDVD